MKKLALLILSLIFYLSSFSQQTVGLFQTSELAFDGYTLFSPQHSKITYLIDNCGEKIHSWSSDFLPGLSSYLLENGVLLRTGRQQGMGGGSGIVEMIDWDGNVVWSYSAISDYGRQHHDVEYLPNGNILLIVWDNRSQAEVEQTGSSTTNNAINSEQIIEIQPNLETGETSVVWEWKAWDHLIQNQDETKDNFGVVSENPERIDINFLNHNNPDWLHFNGVDYNEELDQIIISVHNFSEFWIIDHSTTTQEATSSNGGKYGKGGDLLYRWGNPRAYDQGNLGDQKLFLQHHTHWIPNPLPDSGKIILFNNQAGNPQNQDFSTVNIVDLPVDADGNYEYNGGAFGPVDFDWTYQAPEPTSFFSNIISGVQRLANGNTLICEGTSGRFFEVNSNKEIVWEYVNPVNDDGAISQNTIPQNNGVFRCTRYADNYPGFEGRTLIPQGYIEIGSTFVCNETSDECDPAVIFANETTNAVCFEELDYVRKCYTNNIPGHSYGPFGGMNTLEGQDFDYSFCLYPELGEAATEIKEDPSNQGCGNGIIFGISIQGINFSPFARLYWVNPNTQEENLNWHVEADFTLNMDLNGGHVNNVSRYHYHNIPLDYFTNDLGIDGTDHSPIVGYAADGFPIYYKFLYADILDSSSGIAEYRSGYKLRSGQRSGDGISAPNGIFDGTYIEDYEYDSSLSTLDECGAIFARTPEYPEGTYLYVLTDNWPYIPRCLRGKYVDNSFRLGPNCPSSTAFEDCSMIPTGISEFKNTEISVEVYPNPVSKYLNVRLNSGVQLSEIIGVKIYNMNATIVYNASTHEQVIDLEGIAKGIYFIQFETETEQVTKKIVIQ